MQVISPNNVKIYNLSAGKSLPDWITDRKKRNMIKKDPELRDRIELIQDFDMPIVSNQVQTSPDGQYIYASGVYKPRVKCFDITQFSMKFERCFDSECVKFKILSDDYSKVVFLHNNRYVEFHAQYGRYYTTRIPKFGRDFDYHFSSCDLYFVGTSSEIYRLNLERGTFMTPLKTSCAEETNCCQFNPVHELFACGNSDGIVECWDPRAQPRQVGMLNCALDSLKETAGTKVAVTALKFRDGLNLAVGTSTGHILMYDIRSNRPVLIKDHRYELPIKDIQFHKESDLVFSIDKRVCKIWERNTGKPYTSIESGTNLNNICLVPDSGMLFMANEAPKILVYYIPSIGPAPKWCSFLDNLTEELEANPVSTVYDDYKFVTKKELETLGLSNLVGTNVLRAYMHGYFMDIRLYKKAKLVNEPFNFDEFKQRKIKENLEKEKENRVKIVKRLPQVNSELAKRIIEEENDKTLKSAKNKKANENYHDERFSKLFADPDFQIDPESEEFRLLNPVVQKVNEKKLKKSKTAAMSDSEEGEDDEAADKGGSDSDDSKHSESSSDDEHQWKQSIKEQHKLLNQEKKAKAKLERQANYNKMRSAPTTAPSSSTPTAPAVKQPAFYEIKSGQEYYASSSTKPNKVNEMLKNEQLKKLPLSNRLEHLTHAQMLTDSTRFGRTGAKEDTVVFRNDSLGNKQMTFVSKKVKREKESEKRSKEHHLERKTLRRSAGKITKSFKIPNKMTYVKKKN